MEAFAHHGLTFGAHALRAFRRYPDRAAFVWDGGQLTYGGCIELIARLEAALLGLGFQRGERLALLSENSAESWCCNLAALSLGIGTTWLHPKASVDDQLFQISDCRAKGLLVDAIGHAERARILGAKLPPETRLLGIGKSDFGVDIVAEAERRGTQSPVVLAAPTDLALIHYTGGTTGRSKGAARSHRSAVAFNSYACLADFSFPTTPNYLALAPNSHAAGTLLTPIWHLGGRVYLPRAMDPDVVLDQIARDRINMSFVVPTTIYALLDAQRSRRRDVSSLELLFYGAAPMSPTRLAEALETLGPVFQQGYGQTEYYPATVLRRSDHDAARPELLASCGSPISTAELVLLDGDGQPSKPGEPGEICLRGPGAMDAYWERPDLTAETIQSGWVHTGDIATLDDRGYVYIVDRKKDMIISGGFNVYPREVEDALATHEAVALAAVIGTPDDRWGEAVTAFVVLRAGKVATPESLIQHVRDRKGAIQTPKRIEIVEALPLTAIGKIDKKALRAKFWSGTGRQIN